MITKTNELLTELKKNTFEYGFFTGHDTVFGTLPLAEGVEVAVFMDMDDLYTEVGILLNGKLIEFWQDWDEAVLEVALLMA